MAGSESFTLVDKTEPPKLFDEFKYRTSARTVDLNAQFTAWLRQKFPEMTVTTVTASNCMLMSFAAAGYAEAVLDIDTDAAVGEKIYFPPLRRGQEGGLGDFYSFAKYRYAWRDEYFIVYTILFDFDIWQYVLKEPMAGETASSDSQAVNSLLMAVGAWETSAEGIVYVFDGFWSSSRKLWEQVEESSWDNVILDSHMKKELRDVAGNFFDSTFHICYN